MSNDDELPTIGQVISNWLGVQLPTVPMPQTLKNFDKAVGRVLFALGENVETRVKRNTAKAKAKGKIDVDGMYRNEEEKRKVENRAGATKAALEEMQVNPSQKDAESEIDDDWLNIFARLAEDKSSEELQILFGKILAGEVSRPGSFSLRTMQIMATISKSDAERLSKLLSFSLNGKIIPFQQTEDRKPTVEDRLFLEELGVAGHPSAIAGLKMDVTVNPNSKRSLWASKMTIVVENNMTQPARFSVPGQPLTSSAFELIRIANSPPTNIEFLKKIAKQIYAELKSAHKKEIDESLLAVHVATTTPVSDTLIKYQVVHTVGD